MGRTSNWSDCFNNVLAFCFHQIKNLKLFTMAETQEYTGEGDGGTPSFGLYGDVSLDRVWFFGLATGGTQSC